MSLVSVHLITLLQARGVGLASAISYGTIIGPAQVAARVIEMSNMGRHHPLWTLTAAFCLVAIGLGLMALGVPGLGVWLVLYGGGNGIYSIARGTVRLALFGPDRYAGLVGRLARPGLIARRWPRRSARLWSRRAGQMRCSWCSPSSPWGTLA